jgi:hypothetical protein
MDFLQLGIQIAVPILLFWIIWRTDFKGRRDWLVHNLPFAAVLIGLLITARWDVSSYYLRLVIPIVLIALASTSYLRSRKLSGRDRKPKTSDVVIGIAVFAFSAVWVGFALRGYSTPGGAVALEYPLRNGTYYVGGGGNSRLINNHQAVESQKFALDIARLNLSGNRAWPPMPGNLDDYTIFGDTVYSPCAGEVLVAVDSLPDLVPPDRDEVNLAGNHVVVGCHDVKVLLAHLMSGSIPVSEGWEVAAGDVVGQVGNSGNTSEPHLHIHAEKSGRDAKILAGEGVPITFDGRFLVRNSLFSGREPEETLP